LERLKSAEGKSEPGSFNYPKEIEKFSAIYRL